jgi:chromate transporter
LVAGLVLWVLALGALTLAGGWNGTLAQMGWFFSKAALLTFGGAYAVLPYVFQGAVELHGWLTAAQMIDGLALGETTPGPLIMVVAFVGFLGAGVAGALVATYFTFLPSFVFIFAGAPFVETTHGNLKFSAPLTGITAAVVGVIVNLALFFAWHVLWPRGWDGGFDWPSAVIGAAAFVALFRYKAGIMPVIGACALAGLAVTFLSRLA